MGAEPVKVTIVQVLANVDNDHSRRVFPIQAIFWRQCVTCVFCIAILSLSGVIDAHSQAADESGTLLIAARVNNAVIISIDSRVTSTGIKDGFLAPRTSTIDSTRKLFAFGKISACALSGYLGTVGTGLDVAPSLREWGEAHHDLEALDSLSDLLEIIIEVWNKHGYTPNDLPLKRQVGDNISTLVCGGITNGEPRLMWGKVVVGVNGKPVAKYFPEDQHDLLYLSGVIPDAFTFSNLALNPSYYLVDNAVLMTVKTNLRKALHESPKNAESYDSWAHARDIAGSSTDRVPSSLIAKSWNLDRAKQLLGLTFAAVETSASNEVAPPNNAYIIQPCGRKLATVEQEIWPDCSKKNPPAIQHH